MIWIVKNLWLIPVLPLVAAGIIAVHKQAARKRAAGLAIGSMAIGFLLSLCAFAATLNHGKQGLARVGEGPFREVFSFNWIQFGGQWMSLGWILDPLTAIMLVMVTFVGMLISSSASATWRTIKTSCGSSVSSRCLPPGCSEW